MHWLVCQQHNCPINHQRFKRWALRTLTDCSGQADSPLLGCEADVHGDIRWFCPQDSSLVSDEVESVHRVCPSRNACWRAVCLADWRPLTKLGVAKMQANSGCRLPSCQDVLLCRWNHQSAGNPFSFYSPAPMVSASWVHCTPNGLQNTDSAALPPSRFRRQPYLDDFHMALT